MFGILGGMTPLPPPKSALGSNGMGVGMESQKFGGRWDLAILGRGVAAPVEIRPSVRVTLPN